VVLVIIFTIPATLSILVVEVEGALFNSLEVFVKAILNDTDANISKTTKPVTNLYFDILLTSS
jgi:hypothetical protein